jgi:hypothetical protein
MKFLLSRRLLKRKFMPEAFCKEQFLVEEGFLPTLLLFLNSALRRQEWPYFANQKSGHSVELIRHKVL